MIPIHQWPEQDRPREKLLANGTSALTDAELLALFIRSGTPGHSALDVARAMLSDTGGLRALLGMDFARARQVRGLGLARFCELQGALELGRRWLKEQLSRSDIVSNASSAAALMQATLQDQKVEIFVCMSLDSQLRMIALDEIARGGLSEISLSARQVVETALTRRAHGVIVAHNHPAGSAEASDADKRFTKKLTDALRTVDIALHDHLLIADGAPRSFREAGWM